MTARGRTVKVFTEKIESGERQRVPDEVIVEEPISIRLDGELIGTTMRTPGNDFELAAGFCLTEGLLHEAKIKSIRYCGQSTASEAEFNDVTRRYRWSCSEASCKTWTRFVVLWNLWGRSY